jgi:hypothetical protein
MRKTSRQIACSVLWILLLVGIRSQQASAFLVNTTDTGVELKWNVSTETYFINPAGGPGESISAITTSYQTWTDVSTSAFFFVYGGTTASDATGVRDGMNLVSFGVLESASIATTFTWYDTVTGEISDSDIRLSTAFPWSADGAPGTMDVQNIVTHESGHSLSLADLYDSADSEKTMYGFSSSGETKKRSLDPDDIAGITHLYPVPNASIVLSSPDGGETWEQGSSHDILWSVSGDAGPTVRIELLKGGIVNGTIASSVQNDGSFAWNVPAFQAVGTDYRIRVASSSNGSVFDDSDGNFSIVSPLPPPPVVLTGLSISGPVSVPEGTEATYTATASWSDESTSQVTPLWSVTPTTFASISAAGVLSTLAVPSDQLVTVSASYTFGGVTETAQQPVTIADGAATLTGLAIAGPASVPEGSGATYTATASWSDGSTTPVTPLWSVFPTTFASISAAGVLSTLPVPSDQSVTVSASYTFGGVTETAQQPVTIADAAATLTGLAIAGPASVNETGSVQYAATASWSDGSATPVTPVWSVSPTIYASIDAAGVLSTLPVPSDQSVTVSASYTFGGVTETAQQPVTIVDVAPPEDLDGDGVPDTEEMGPEGTDGNYDGNRDGLPDGEQDNVASLHTFDGAHYVTIAGTGKLSDVMAVGLPADAPSDVSFPYGIFSFATDVPTPGAPAAMQILLDGISVDTYYKFGGEPDDLVPHWYEFLFEDLTQTGAEFPAPFEITLHLVDGDRGDDDLTVDGTIIDQGGPGIVQVPPPPPQAPGGGGGCAVVGGQAGWNFRETMGARGILILAFVLLAIRGKRRKPR